MKKGFTLIELLIVITIIGILAVAFLPSLLGAPSKARDTQRISDIQKIAGVLTQFSIAQNLPASACIDGGTGSLVTDGVIKASDFGGRFPDDPRADNTSPGGDGCAAGTYAYVKGGTGGYFLSANVENTANGNYGTCPASTVDPNTLQTTSAGECYVYVGQ